MFSKDEVGDRGLQFTGNSRDAETGLDYFGARYFFGAQGRFTSPDPLMASGDPANPQSWNRYAYVLNNPLRFIDPTGEIWVQANGGWDWADECPEGGTCRGTVAQAVGNTVTVYGANSRDDISTYQANTNGVVNVADIANNIYADFTVAPQQVAENYLNPATAAALFNVADQYKQQYPGDSNLVFTGGSAETGRP